MKVQAPLRFAAVLALGVWLGGFAFYSGLVIPVLHDAMSSPEAGRITQRVTDRLNGIGVLALTMAWGLEIAERRPERRGGTPSWRSRWRLGLLIGLTFSLAALAGLHEAMDRHLETRGLSGFYPLHRAYLLISTAQWLAEAGLLWTWTAFWSRPAPPE